MLGSSLADQVYIRSLSLSSKTNILKTCVLLFYGDHVIYLKCNAVTQHCCCCRFKSVADSAMENKKGGAYSQEVDNILHRKAHAIINCYLNSPVPPKIQVKLCS